VKRVVTLLVALSSVAVVAGCKSDGRALKPASPDQSLSIVVPTTVPPTTLPPAGGTQTGDTQAGVPEGLPAEVSSTALSLSGYWVDGGPLPPDSTCKGKGLSPDLKWANIPANATELVLTVTDADASGFVHWVLAGIDPATPGIAQGKIPRGTVQTLNSAPAIGWFAPCPPQGTHRYIFSLFVLTKPSGILAGMDPADAIAGLSIPGVQSVAITGTASS
jgi:Raf kinase inhibitor-like YbhB/YbcL family protein